MQQSSTWQADTRPPCQKIPCSSCIPQVIYSDPKILHPPVTILTQFKPLHILFFI
jgi:hypothetical protein